MAGAKRKAGNGWGLVLWLYILGGADLCLAVIIITVMLADGWPGVLRHMNICVGLCALLMFVQWALRVPTLIISARWTWWMTQRTLMPGRPASPTWAWLGWFMPVVSLWQPCGTMLRLNRDADGRGRHAPLILAWWLMRWFTYPSGFMILVFACAAILLFAPDRQQAASWLVYLAIPSALSAALGIAVNRLTFNNQPSDNAMLAATVF